MKVMSVAATAITWDTCGRPRLNIRWIKNRHFLICNSWTGLNVLLFLFPDTTNIRHGLNMVLFQLRCAEKKSAEQKGQIYRGKKCWSLLPSFLVCQQGANQCITLIPTEFIQREFKRNSKERFSCVVVPPKFAFYTAQIMSTNVIPLQFLRPSPSKPSLHSHVNDPGLLIHSASLWQRDPYPHSFTSKIIDNNNNNKVTRCSKNERPWDIISGW